jgi:hypothetical protein
MKPYLLAALVCLLSLPAFAQCYPGETQVLACSARNGTKEISLCIAGDTIRYSYGKPGLRPELILSEPITTVAHQPWGGVGRAIWEATTLHNGAFSYEIYASVDRMAEENPESGGVSVYNGNQHVTDVACDVGQIDLTLWAVQDAKEAAGMCWRHETQTWGDC